MSPIPARYRTPTMLLLLMAVAVPLSNGTWMALVNNFAVERAAFSGADIGIMQSLREIPGLLSFTIVFLLLILREQTVAIIALLLLGIGTSVTGLFPSFWGLIFVAMLTSIGFHYFETVNQSLQLQWLKKEVAPVIMGRLVAAGAFASLTIFGIIYLALKVGGLAMEWVYLLGGGLTVLLAILAWLFFPTFPEEVFQHRRLVLRRRYWLYYALTFMAGARRQIFMVFAGFLMVEKFGFSAAAISLMFLVNMAINMVAAPHLGRLILRWGERRALSLEYLGLFGVFVGYAVVEIAWVAVLLYILDHIFFTLAIAMRTYFQKIADPADIAPSAGVAFSINHIAAVVMPALFGLLWLISPPLVFLAGASLTAISLFLARLIPSHPEPGREVLPLRPAAARLGHLQPRPSDHKTGR